MQQKRRIERLTQCTYSNLTPEERLRLVLMHEAEKNHEEALRVAKGSPVATYRMVDPAYAERIAAAYHLAREGVIGIIAKYMFILQLLLDLETKCALCCLRWPIEGVGEDDVHITPELPPPSPECVQAMKNMAKSTATMRKKDELIRVGHARQVVLELMKTEWLGFDACCREHLGVDGKTLLHAFGGPFFVEWFEKIEVEFEELKLNQELKEHIEPCRDRYAELFRNLSGERKEQWVTGSKP